MVVRLRLRSSYEVNGDTVTVTATSPRKLGLDLQVLLKPMVTW